MISKILKKYESLTVEIRATLWFFLCNIFQKGISFVTVPIFARILTTEQYGVYSLYLSWFELILKFTSMNLYLGVFNNAMVKYDKDKRDRFVSSIQGLCFVLELFVLAIYFLWKNWINNFMGFSTNIMLLMFAQLLVSPCIQFWSTKLRFEFKYRPIVVVTLVQSLANPILGLVLVYGTEDKALARIVSVVLVEVIVGGIIMIYQYIRGKCFFDAEMWKYAFFFNLPLIPHYLSSTILNHGDRIMISKMVGESAAGIYSVAYSVGMLIQLVTNAINSTFTPWFYQRMKEKSYDEIRKLTTFLFVIMMGGTICAMLFAPEIVYLFGSHEYMEAVYIVPPVSASVFFIFMYNTFIYSEYYFEENKMIMFASMSAAILNIILNYVFIMLFGYLAAGYTTLVSYIFLAMFHYILSRRACKKHNCTAHLFDKKLVTILITIEILCSIVVNFLFKTYLLRYGLFVLIIFVCFLNRNRIISKLSVLKKKK